MTRTHSHFIFYKFAVLALLASALLSIALYMSLTFATIFATASRSHAAFEGAALASRIGVLENQYLTRAKTITEGEAGAQGFVLPTKVTLVSDRPVLLSLKTE